MMVNLGLDSSITSNLDGVANSASTHDDSGATTTQSELGPQ
jgi:hypothetical protein